MKSIIDKIFLENLKRIPETSVESLCIELFKAKLISAGVTTLDDIIEDFKASLDFADEPSEVIGMCSKFLKVIHSVPGPCVMFANKVNRVIVKDIKNELNFDVDSLL